MSEEELTQTIRDPREASQAVQIRDNNDEIENKNFKSAEEEENSEIEFNSDISSSTELGEEKFESAKTRIPGIDLRRSKRLTKTSHIVRLNNPIVPGFYRKHSGQTKCPSHTR